MSEQGPRHFIYVFDPVRPEMVTSPEAWTEKDLRIAEKHFSYLKKATEDGIVILAGRSLDGKGPAVVILEATSEEEARRFMEGDPFVAYGLMRAHLHPFRAALVRSK
ncbi:MAG TPA: YciI family protein [Anaerolineae bacterium]|nr:YciI family protein [Anaerolineae bacterium]